MEGGDRTWTLPLAWLGKGITVRGLGGTATSAVAAASGRALVIKNTPKRSPVILTVALGAGAGAGTD